MTHNGQTQLQVNIYYTAYFISISVYIYIYIYFFFFFEGLFLFILFILKGLVNVYH